MTALLLDRQRLGKQRVEARQILNTLLFGGGWANHPAVRMWRGFEAALVSYGDIIIHEWMRRGYRNSMPLLALYLPELEMPPWLGDPALHASHRSNLLRKAPEHYNRFGWTERPDLPYVWPK
jgi:hypothetical protein